MAEEHRKQIEAVCDAVFGPAPERISFWMDDDGWLWSGPHKEYPDLRFARFVGFMTTPPFAPIWAPEAVEADSEWMWQTDEMVDVYMKKIQSGAWKLPTYENGD